MNNQKVLISVENMGNITVELYADKAPLTVENFISLVKSGFYSGLIFHRVIPGFMIQGGGMTPAFENKKATAIKGEFASNGFAQNDIAHARGVISMARTNDKNSASSQFFIMHEDSPFLDGEYAAFGMVTDGMDVVDMIANTQTGNYMFYQDVPVSPIVISEMKLI
ncbi:MAG: peptidylprolyl isomerase [Clostridia bacterium]|nr:peptidylprolyl isomerase [Clostridia bacterium]